MKSETSKEGLLDKINKSKAPKPELVTKILKGSKSVDLLEFIKQNTILDFETLIQNLKNISYCYNIEEIVKIYVEKLNEDNTEG